MHFFYLDEAGCNGANLAPGQEPIFILGGVSVKDQGWVKTTEVFEKTVREYFNPDPVPDNFELHSFELLSPNGEGPFHGHDRGKRNKLALDLLGILAERSHHVHYIAIDKSKLANTGKGDESPIFNSRIPYLLGFNYLITYIEHRVKNNLGHTARGITIVDKKDMYDDDIAKLIRFRRFETKKSQRIKWLVEFSYPIDSQKHPLIQLSDLVVFCTKKFLELDTGHRDTWPDEAKEFFVRCFEKIYDRLPQKSLITQSGKDATETNELLKAVAVVPRSGWKKHYGIAPPPKP